MRIIWLAGLAMLGLSACSGGSDDQARNDSTEPEAAIVAPGAETAFPEVPERFRGTYDINAVACGSTGGEMRLIVDGREMRFHESIGRVERVVPRADGAIDVDVVSTGEGITEQRQYRLAEQGGRLSVTSGGTRAMRVRCNAPEAAAAGNAVRIPVNLAPDGLQLVDPSSGRSRMIAFGTPRAETLALVRAGLGEPSSSGTCPVAPLTDARFGDAITLSFENDLFVGWAADPRAGETLATASGVRIGSTRAEMEQSIVAEISRTSLGNEFNAGGLAGVLDGAGRDARIEALWAGMTCIAR